jgi:DNA-binding transcriptional ArsR family regulator
VYTYVYASFDALGNPTRRRVLELLREGPRSVGEVAAQLPVTRPAVSQHLAALRRAGLVTYAVEGRRHVYGVDRAALAETRAWFEGFWDVALERYASTAAVATATPSPHADPGAPGQPGAETTPPTGKKPKKRGKRKKKGRKERG